MILHDFGSVEHTEVLVNPGHAAPGHAADRRCEGVQKIKGFS